MKKRALITGVSGQDGTYLAELLVQKNYEVHGLLRPLQLESSRTQYRRSAMTGIPASTHLHFGDPANPLTMLKLLKTVQPDECYHLAAPSFVSYNLEQDLSDFHSGFNMAHALVSSMIETAPKCRLYFAGTSELFGNAEASPQTETTAMKPRSLYGISKLASYHLFRNFREKQGLFVSTGFLYNHESPRRAAHFVTRKISIGVAKISLGLEQSISLGNLDVSRDWGYAPEYVEAMWRMLQLDAPDDFVIATGQSHSLREFIDIAFSVVGLNWQNHVKTDPAFFRSAETTPLVGDPRKAERVLGWKATKPFESWIEEMVRSDVKWVGAKSGMPDEIC